MLTAYGANKRIGCQILILKRDTLITASFNKCIISLLEQRLIMEADVTLDHQLMVWATAIMDSRCCVVVVIVCEIFQCPMLMGIRASRGMGCLSVKIG